MEESTKEQTYAKNGAEEKENEIFQTLIVEDVKYKTRLNKKFLTRKPYEPVDPKKVQAFIPGTIGNIFIKKGKKVKTGQKMIELEAMKMVNTIFAEFDAVILDIPVRTGESVSKNQVLIQFK
ncbi:MAG: acetyl-CoA carboxylase biotin carboxyl carrier protein subunit [Bacteroidetes bacterium]|nr:acetyl-CoA carboxylase biotin carboxyl carrier protein subunit [Bacteroidota bacterium]